MCACLLAGWLAGWLAGRLVLEGWWVGWLDGRLHLARSLLRRSVADYYLILQMLLFEGSAVLRMLLVPAAVSHLPPPDSKSSRNLFYY